MPKKITEKQMDEIIQSGPRRILAKVGKPEQKPDILAQLMKANKEEKDA